MTNQLTQKERSLLQDQLSHEEICIKKYRSYASRTQCPELRNLFNELAQEEQNHYDTLSRYLGNHGRTQQGQGQGQTQQAQQAQQTQQSQQMRKTQFEVGDISAQSHSWSQEFQGQQGQQPGQTDEAAMCRDMLMTEKFVSSAYDTSVFESANPQLRRDLQKIQDDEQKHGEKIFNYMQKRGFYNPQ